MKRHASRCALQRLFVSLHLAAAAPPQHTVRASLDALSFLSLPVYSVFGC